MKVSKQYIIGLDEVGRGPLAGPVLVGGVFCLSGFDKSPLPPFIKGENNWINMITDSKKLNAKKREYLTEQLLACSDIVWATSFVSAKIIDRDGIVAAIRTAALDVIYQIIQQVTPLLGDEFVENLEILLDGKTDYGLRKELVASSKQKVESKKNITLQTIIKGDSLIREIGAASIIAKVQRDQYMTDLSRKKKYQSYGFDHHKGYGTLVHRQAIAEYGLSDQHRKSFCKDYTNLLPYTTVKG